MSVLLELLFHVNVTSKDNFANFSPMYFDNSVFDFYGALFNGASLSPVPKKVMDNPRQLVQFVDDLKCTIWFSVPSLLVFMLNMKVMTKLWIFGCKMLRFFQSCYFFFSFIVSSL